MLLIWVECSANCKSLTNINLANFNIQNVNCIAMFSECESLTYINLANFNTQKVNKMNEMIYGCNYLIKKIII